MAYVPAPTLQNSIVKASSATGNAVLGVPANNGTPTPPIQPGYGIGFGGADYNTLNAAGKTAMSANAARLASDPNYDQSELARTNTVIANRSAQGLDNTAQNSYLNTVKGYMPQSTPAPQTPTVAANQSTPAPQGSFPGQLTSAQIQAEAQARIDKQLAAAQTAATGALTGAKNAYDYSQQTTQGNRALLQFDNSNRGDQFGGSAREDLFRLQRQQGIEDTAQNNNYNAQVAQINQKLQDIQTAAPGDQQAMIDQLTKQERDYGVQVGQLTGQFNGSPTLAAQGQAAQYTGQYGGQPTLQAQNQNFQQGIAQAGLTGNYNNQRTLAGQNADLNSAQVMAQLTGKMPDGTLTNAAQQQQLANEWTASDKTGVISPALAQMYGIPAGTPTEQAKQFAQTLHIQQQQANTSQQGVNNSYQLGLGNQAIAQQNADTQLANSQRADSQTGLDNLYKSWQDSGSAPAGIPGVTQGTSLYDRTAAQRAIMDAYKTWSDTGKAPAGIPGVAEGTPLANKVTTRYQGMNDAESSITQQLDSLPKGNVKAALQGEKSAIISKVGTSGYQKIYNLYFDPITGAPK